MEIYELMEKKGEGLKRLGAIVWALNRIEIDVITHITIFFTDWAGNHHWKSIIFNRALFNEKVYPSLENKRQLFLKIVQGLEDIAEWKGIKFDNTKWLNLCKSIQKIQEIRNALSHNFLSFSDDGSKAIIGNSKDLTGPYSRREIDLNDTLKEVEDISKSFSELLTKFLEQAQVVLNSPDPIPKTK